MPQAEHVDELVDGRRRAGAAEDDRVLGPSATRPQDDLAGLLAEAGRLEAGAGRLGVRVGVERQDRVADVVLDEGERATGGRVVGVGHAAHAERPSDGLVVADDRAIG